MVTERATCTYVRRTCVRARGVLSAMEFSVRIRVMFVRLQNVCKLEFSVGIVLNFELKIIVWQLALICKGAKKTKWSKRSKRRWKEGEAQLRQQHIIAN